jgi:hypothetical protein
MTREILGEGEPSAEAAPPKLLPGAIDWTKPVRTKGRRLPVTIYAVDPALKKPVVGKIHDEYAEVTDWHLNGSFHPTKGESGLDLENVPAAQAAPEPSGEGSKDELIKALEACDKYMGEKCKSNGAFSTADPMGYQVWKKVRAALSRSEGAH